MSEFLNRLDEMDQGILRAEVDALLGLDSRLLIAVDKTSLHITGLTEGAQSLLGLTVLEPIAQVLSQETIEALRACAQSRSAASLRESIDEELYFVEIRPANDQLLLYLEPADTHDTTKQLYQFANHEVDRALGNILAWDNFLASKKEESLAEAVRGIRVNSLRAYRQIQHVRRLTEESAYAIPSFEEIDAAKLCQTLAEQVRARLPDGITLKTEIPKTLPAVLCKELMEEALSNLLVNACKVKGVTQVTLTAQRQKTRVVFRVSNDGESLDPHKLSTLYNGWEQRQTAIHRLECLAQGTAWGLGLPVVRENIRRHGGILLMEPQTPQGTKFIISLPDSIEPLPGLYQMTSWEEPGLDPIEVHLSPLM